MQNIPTAIVCRGSTMRMGGALFEWTYHISIKNNKKRYLWISKVDSCYQMRFYISGVRVGQSYFIFYLSMFIATVPKALLLYSWGQWVNPILDLNALSLLSLFIALCWARGTIVTVMTSLASLFIFSSLKAGVGSLILPPWMVLESHNIRSPALH